MEEKILSSLAWRWSKSKDFHVRQKSASLDDLLTRIGFHRAYSLKKPANSKNQFFEEIVNPQVRAEVVELLIKLLPRESYNKKKIIICSEMPADEKVSGLTYVITSKLVMKDSDDILYIVAHN